MKTNTSLIDEYDFYGKTFRNTYSKFVDTYIKYCELHGVKYDKKISNKLSQEYECINVISISKTLAEFETEDYEKKLSESQEFKFGVHKIDINTLWLKLTKEQKNKIYIFFKLLHTTSDNIITNAKQHKATSINVFEGIGNHSSNFSIQDLQNNIITTTEVDKGESSAFPGINMFNNITNKMFEQFGINNDNVENFLHQFKDKIKEDGFEKKMHSMISESMGSSNYDKNLKNIVGDVMKNMSTKLNDVDISKLKFEPNNISSGLFQMASQILPNQKDFSNKYKGKISEAKAMNMLTSIMSKFPNMK